MTGRAARVIALAGLLALLPVPPGRPGAPAYAAHTQADDCRVDRRGNPGLAHDPKANITFTAILKKGRKKTGEPFPFGEVADLLINVRWKNVNESARQRLELYAPDGHLYQMFNTTLSADPDPVEIRVPVIGSWIMQSTLAGEWCAKVFLDDDLDPVAMDGFELKFPRRQRH